MTGKQTCDILKQIRRDIAKKNDINIPIRDCPHGEDVRCPGTCPRCEAETRALEKALNDREKNGKKLLIAGISAGLVVGTIAGVSSCSPLPGDQLEGDISAVYTSDDGTDADDESSVTDTHATDTRAFEGDLTAPEETSGAPAKTDGG